jgi:hypothetical protein
MVLLPGGMCAWECRGRVLAASLLQTSSLVKSQGLHSLHVKGQNMMVLLLLLGLACSCASVAGLLSQFICLQVLAVCRVRQPQQHSTRSRQQQHNGVLASSFKLRLHLVACNIFSSLLFAMPAPLYSLLRVRHVTAMAAGVRMWLQQQAAVVCVLCMVMYISFALATAMLHHMHVLVASQELISVSFPTKYGLLQLSWLAAVDVFGLYLSGSPGGLVALHVLYMAGWGFVSRMCRCRTG